MCAFVICGLIAGRHSRVAQTRTCMVMMSCVHWMERTKDQISDRHVRISVTTSRLFVKYFCTTFSSSCAGSRPRSHWAQADRGRGHLTWRWHHQRRRPRQQQHPAGLCCHPHRNKIPRAWSPYISSGPRLSAREGVGWCVGE